MVRILRARSILILLVTAWVAFAVTGCGVDDIDISGYDDETITIKGVSDREVTISIAQLKELECVTIKAESTSDKIGKVRATGPTLDTVLSQYGISQADLKNIKIHGRDDYDIKIGSDVLGEDTVVLAFGIDGKPLDEESAPLRIVIPGSDSAYWIRMVDEIECIK